MTTLTRRYIIDAGALIRGVRLEKLVHGGDDGQLAELVTVPEVIAEVRDRDARHLLASLPVELGEREPSDEAMSAVSAFARQTGDLRSLSRTDLKVLALTYMLEKEIKGDVSHLETVPKVSGTAEQAIKKQEEKEEKKVATDEAFFGGWVTPENVERSHTAYLHGTVKDVDKALAAARRARVACITTDFAMQNVILQMGMVLVSADGMFIKHIRTYALQCHGCHKITRDMDKVFCPVCGHDSLVKVSLKTTKRGVVAMPIRKPRGAFPTPPNFTLPPQKGGRNATNPILSEDQLQQVRRKQGKASFGDHESLGDRGQREKGYMPDDVIIGHPKRSQMAPKRRRRKKH